MSASTGDTAEADRWARWMRSAVNSLGGTQREMVMLVYFRGMTQGEAARELGVPPMSVRSGIAEALRGLAAIIETRGAV
ncbi:MAG: hypothetical protein M3070_10255 [Actinomycetota bacterium]|nr:hypothetical protein [Actinomycetota bacterium]